MNTSGKFKLSHRLVFTQVKQSPQKLEFQKRQNK